VQASLAAAIDYLEQDGLGIGALGLGSDGLDGKVDGQFKIALPLASSIELSDLKIEGKVKVTDGRAKQVIGPHDIQGATVNIDVGDGAVNAAGQMLVGGVSAKLSFHRIFGASEERQPPLRITATLDAADRNQLGFDINSIVSGDIPVDLTVTRGPRSEQQVRVRADLTGAELNLEPIAWRKAPGRQALLEFDVARGAKGARTELQNFKVVGDDIAIDGNMALDGKGRLSEFSFPNFALTLVSRTELQGTLRGDNVWDIKVKGHYWDGRDYFRRLFAIGQTPEKPAPPKKDQAGVDLKADFETIQGHSDIALKNLRLQMSRRGGRMTGLVARGNVEGGRPIEVGLQQTVNEPRKLVVLTEDAGQAFRMVGFYPNMQGGELRLDVDLDGKGAAEKTGMLEVRRFAILGDPILSEVLQTSGETSREGVDSGRRGKRKVEREKIEFSDMQLPFSVGYNQFVLEKDSQLRGPLMGVLLRGKADFKTQQLDLVGTYSPLQGLNSIPGAIPGAGQVLAGTRGEGVVGITFWATGPISQPQVLVNPLSAILPGAFRGLAEMGPTSFRVIARDDKPVDKPKVKLPQAPGAGQAYRQGTPAAGTARTVEPELSGGWSTSEPKKK
jgi:AsmA-like C-terminal region